MACEGYNQCTQCIGDTELINGYCSPKQSSSAVIAVSVVGSVLIVALSKYG